MSAFFFGTQEHRLFGYYHAPGADAIGGVLLCQPWGVEYEHAHRTMRFLADRLGARGWHVLRFDYRGTGDSWGGTTDANLTAWVADVAEAAAELRAISDFESIGLVGLRLGANVSAMASSDIQPLGRCVLWDPILDGQQWVAELESLTTHEPGSFADEGFVELGSHTVSTAFRNQLLALDRPDPPSGRNETLILLTTANPRGVSVLDQREAGCQVELLPQPSPWLGEVALGLGQIPVAAVSRIVEWMEGR